MYRNSHHFQVNTIREAPVSLLKPTWCRPWWKMFKQQGDSVSYPCQRCVKRVVRTAIGCGHRICDRPHRFAQHTTTSHSLLRWPVSRGGDLLWASFVSSELKRHSGPTIVPNNQPHFRAIYRSDKYDLFTSLSMFR